MAGKKKLDSGPMLLGGLDLDDIDSLLDDGSGSSNAGPRTVKGSVRKLSNATQRTIKDRVNAKSVLASFIRTALPDGYTRLLGLYDEGVAGIESVVDGIEETEFASLEKLADKFENQLPKLKGKLPDAVYERIKARIEEGKESAKLRREIHAAQSAKNKGEYNEQAETAAVDSMFSEMAEAQLDLENANNEVEHNKLDYQVKRDGIRARLDKSRFDLLNRHLGMIADASQRNTAYNDTVTYQFQKKSLELQMRSYLAQRALVKVSTDTLNLQRQAFTALVTNTGLPEFLKATEAERIKFTLQERMRDPFKNMLSKTAGDFAANFLPNLFNNVGRKTAGVVRGASQVGEGGMAALLKSLMENPEENVGGLLGDKLASILHRTVIPTVARKVKPGVQRASNKYTRGADSRLAYALDNLGAITQNFANDAKYSTGWKGGLQNLVRMVAPQFRLNDLVKSGTYQTIDQAASFNQMTQRSIVEVIPGYLSRILHETRMIRTGDHSISRETYDITRGQFREERTAQDNLAKRIVGMGARRSVKWSLNNTVDAFDSKGKLSPEAKHALEERLLRDAMEGKHFDPAAYIRPEGYAPGTDPAVLSELEGFFKRKFKFDEKGQLKKLAANFSRRQEFSTRFNELRDTSRNPIGEIERLLASGNHTALRDLGIIKTVEGEDRIDYAVLRDLYRDLGDPTASGEPPTPPTPMNPILSNLRKSLREKAGNARRRIGKRTGDIRDRAKAAMDGVELPDSAVVREAVEKTRGALVLHTNDLKARTGDLLVAGKEGVVVKAEEIINGTLIDARTQKVIGSIDDIKGEVIDITGKVRLTTAEVAAGLITTDGRRYDVLKHLPTKVPANVMALLAGQKQTIGNLIRQEDGVMSRVKDLYLEGANDPVIKATGIRAGEYIDVATQKVIETIDDISGPIAHVSKPEEILVTAQEAATKLVDNTGRRFKSSKVLRYLAWATGSSFNITKGLLKIGLATTRKAFMLASKLMGPVDAFLPGSNVPVLTGAKLKRGEYYHENGKVITSFDDLRDGVYSADGNLLVDPEEIPNLINRDGTKHTAAKKRSFIRKLAKKVAMAPVNAARWVGKQWWKGTKAYYRGMGRMIANKFGKSVDKADAYNKEWITPTDSILGQILGVLDRRLPKEEAREGSWQQKLKEAEAAAKAKKEKGKNTRPNKKMAGGGLLAGLANLFKGKEDEDGGTEINLDFGGGDGNADNSEDDKKGKRKKKPRGRLGRMWDRVKGSRVGSAIGRVGGRIAGNSLVSGIAGNAGRMLGGSALASAAGMLGVDAAVLSSLMSGVSLSGIGTGLATGAAAVGSGLATAATAAGTAILGVLGSPVVLGALAVGAVAAGGYWLWNRSSKTSGDFRETRLLQYGIDSTGDQLKILELEAYLEQFATKGKEPRLNINATDPKKIFEIVGLDEDDHEEIMRLATWIDKRFKPVFFTWLRAMHELTPHGTLINELDDKLPDEAKYDFFQIVKTVPKEVYAVLVHPLDDDEIEVTPEEINERITEMLDEWRDKAKAKKEEKNGDTTGAVSAKPSAVGDSPKGTGAASGKKPGIMDRMLSGAKTLAMATPIGMGIAGLVKAVKDNWFGKLFDNAGAVAQIAATPALVAGLVLKSAVDVGAGIFKAGKLTTLQAVRVRAYGRMSLDESTVGALFDAEALLYKQLKFGSDGQAYFDGNLDTLIGTAANYFGVDVTDASSRKAQEFTAWMLQRFIPVGLAYFAAVKQKAQAITPSRIESALAPQDKLAVANAIMTATYEYNGDNISIWKAEPFFNNGTATTDALKAQAEVEITKLKEEVEKAKLASPGTSVKEQENQSKSKLRQTADKIMEKATALGASIKEKLSGFVDDVSEKVGGAVSSVKDWLGFGDKTQAPAQSQYSQAYTPGGTLEQRGNTFQGFAEGNGGIWNSIPLPKANKSREAAMETLRAVQAMTGVDAELLATFCSIESNFDYLVKAGTSSATGWFQFINGTWDEMLRQHGSKYGIPPDNADRYLRKDPRINALMGAEFLKGNYKHLAKALGRAPTDTDLYCAHFMGAGGAAGFLKRDRNAIAASFYPKEANANRSIYYKKTGQPRTIGEIYALFEEKVSKHRKGGGGVDVSKAKVGDAQAVADAQAAANAAAADIKPTDNDAVTGEVGTGSAGATQDSISMAADKAAAPLRMGDPSAGGVAPGAPVAGTSTAVTSGQQIPERQKALEDAAARAAASDKARTQELKEQQAVTASSMGILEEQLNTQIQMRDLLKVIAQSLGKPSVVPEKAAPSAPQTNGMGNQQSTVTERTAGSAPAPLSFNR